ncbi:50S ribosomal protein L25/general stress protein Ctc [Bacillus benzoevorans]|uniref:Large ribosomal subunit protein bL25 n=1 Tax=Bacillus benzoevorans TaxID=1456 RepID=A0A7X0HV86_9BACI|nr:50S ribosomal protein L25/general stress protein Ctc [Bacillus benzoevorans]MBB6447473.1 large subunit ribosomal protein L25 [Bacillus benzoevorans]
MNAVLQAKERKEFRRSELKKLRKEGQIPAVVYGSESENKSIYLNESDLLRTIKDIGRNGVISLDVEGQKKNVILTDYQSDPLKKVLTHIDFLAVDLSKEVTAAVRLVLTGDAAGVKDGGVMQQSLHEISVTATPNNIPSSIEVDVTGLQVAETMTVKDIRGAQSYHIDHDEDEVICSILPPRQEKEISTGETQSEASPENLEGRETGGE